MSVFSWTSLRSGEDEYRSYLCSQAELEVSYARCRSLKIPMELERPKQVISKSSLSFHVVASSVLTTATDQVITSTCYTALSQGYIFILCDPDLVALKLFATPEVAAAAEEVDIKPGTVFTEESCGTNALALAQRHRRLVAIRGEQHYCQLFKDWWCVAGPIRDPNGVARGYLDISTHAEKDLGLAAVLLRTLVELISWEILCLEGAEIGNEPQGETFLPSIAWGHEAHSRLSSREQQVLHCLALGMTNREIADKLYLSIETVKTHRRNIYRKLEVGNPREFLKKIRRLTFKRDIH